MPSAYDLDKCGHRKEVSESFSFLIFLVTPMGLQSVQFPSDVGHDTQERSFLAPRDTGQGIRKTSLLISDAFRKKEILIESGKCEK